MPTPLVAHPAFANARGSAVTAATLVAFTGRSCW